MFSMQDKDSKDAPSQLEDASSEALWDAARLRALWLHFFLKRDHKELPSASLWPHGDPSLLFNSAGMVPFKDYFSGLSPAPCKRIVSVQKCLRATDLESVGKTERHSSFFEMLGNFSFGDYFKKEAIAWAWEFSLEHLRLDPEGIYVTVYKDDFESENIWLKEIGLPQERISKLGKEDNWWGPAGKQGPCGPCSELYWDRGAEFCKTCSCKDKSACAPGNEGGRFLEYWNLVFNEFFQNEKGERRPLPQKGIDTGAGLERILLLLNDHASIYEIPELQHIIHAIEKEALSRSQGRDTQALLYSANPAAYHVIADHLRAVVFSIADHISPANTGRNYVVRRILRRALLYARELQLFEACLYKLAAEVIALYGDCYPELKEAQSDITSCILQEEERFLATLETGLSKWEEFLADHKQREASLFSGESAFVLYDTYGFPLELSCELAAKAGLSIDQEGFDAAMQDQKARSTQAKQWDDTQLLSSLVPLPASDFVGYECYRAQALVLAVIKDTQASAFKGKAFVILDKTPFYAEGGGQLGDQGFLKTQKKSGEEAGESCTFVVEDTQKMGSHIVHIGYVREGALASGDIVEAAIDQERRAGLRQHHSATHLLHAALRKVLGAHIKQTGSLVAPNYLRFDFSHYEKISTIALDEISSAVNHNIAQKAQLCVQTISKEEALKAGAIASFDEKYGEQVRVVSIGEQGCFSMELCGGCHVANTSEIAFFHIIKKSSPGAGKMRIEALAGKGVHEYFQKEIAELSAQVEEHNQEVEVLIQKERNAKWRSRFQTLRAQKSLSQRDLALLKQPQDVLLLQSKLSSIKKYKDRMQRKKIKLTKERTMGERGQNLEEALQRSCAQSRSLGNVQLVSCILESGDIEMLRLLSDRIKQSFYSLVVLLGLRYEKGAALLYSCDKEALKKIEGLDMRHLIHETAHYIDGGGGGRPDMAQAGGKETAGLEKAIQAASSLLQDLLK